jgi:hypothetical protein
MNSLTMGPMEAAAWVAVILFLGFFCSSAMACPSFVIVHRRARRERKDVVK